MKKLKVNKSLSLDSQTLEKINNTKIYGESTFSWKVSSIVDDLLTTIKYTKFELKDKFSPKELSLITDSLKGLIRSNEVNPVILLHSNLSDSIEYNELDVRYNLDKEEFLDKVINLTSFQAYVVLISAKEFWDNNDFASDITDFFIISSITW